MTDLDRAWARTQVEAMADGTLSPESERRMRALVNCDPELRAQVERAKVLRRELRALRDIAVPAGLGKRLWRIPAGHRARPTLWLPSLALASLAAVAVVAGLFRAGSGPTPEELAQTEAVEDFTIVVAYLQKSALMARNEVNEAVGSTMLDVLAMSRGAVGRAESGQEQGAEDNVD